MLLLADLVSYESGGRYLLRDISLSVSGGDLLHVRGRNGVGKSTLLKLLGGLLELSDGRIAGSVFPLGIFYVGHEDGLSEDLTVWENVQFWNSLCGAGGGNVLSNSELMELASYWGLDKFWGRIVKVCSAGERRKASLFRLSLCSSLVWLLDEPFASLDSDSCLFFEGILGSHCSGGGAVIMTHHNEIVIGDCLLSYCDI